MPMTLSGCYPAYGPIMASLEGGAELSFFERTPQMRMGVLLFPVTFWPQSFADPSDLGKHAYCLGPLPPLRLTETSRGLVYTRRAGFVDIAHIRNSIDLTYYAYQKLLPALKKKRTQIVLVGAEPSLYPISIIYPEWLQALNPALQEKILTTLAQRMAQRMSYIIMTWHEIITWYGYKSTLLVGEKWSAFSCDDMFSHLLGAEIAAAFLDLPEDAFERAVTDQLLRRLAELGAVEPEQTRHAVAVVKGVWWDADKQDLIRRQVEINLVGNPMQPWLVSGLSQGQEAASLALPTLENIQGYDCRDMVHAEISPNILEAHAIRRDLNSTKQRIQPEVDFERLAERIHAAELSGRK